MDQNKIGSFIAACRKEKNCTQAALAEKLGITDRAVSKWETGKSLPDAALMLELCEILEISVNELLTGERLNMENYREKAEENLMQLSRQEEYFNKKLLTLELVVGCMATAAFLILIFAAVFAVESSVWKLAMCLTGTLLFIVGLCFALKIEGEAGYYQCPHCGKRYVPEMLAVVMAPHIWRSRYMKCPYCETRGYHKKVLTEK